MFKEKRRFSAILLSHPILYSTDMFLKDVLVGDYEVVNSTEYSGATIVTHFHYISKTPYHRVAEDSDSSGLPKRVKSRKIDGVSHFLYDCFIVEMILKSENEKLFFLGVPFKALLNDSINSSTPKLKSEKISFHYITLPGLVTALGATTKSPAISITRMNLQATGSIGIKTVTLYGGDVLLSSLYDDVRKYTKPSSLKIVCSEDPLMVFGLTTDRVGNWSFYIKKQEELSSLSKLLGFLIDKKLMQKAYKDPRTRRSAQDTLRWLSENEEVG